MNVTIGTITKGHQDTRRVIWDLILGGELTVGHWQAFQLSIFTPVFAGSQIGGAKDGHGHFHKEMEELYIILSGECTMSFVDTGTGEVSHHPVSIKLGEPPMTFAIPAGIGHRLLAATDTMLLIASSDKQRPEDTFECTLPNYTP